MMRGQPKPATHFRRFPEGGGYPLGFPEWVFSRWECDPADVLHLCSGSVTTGTRVDIRPETKPDIVADCRDVPLPDQSFDWIMADPPYAETYAENLYGTGRHYPRPGSILTEAYRLLRPGGLVGILHFIVPQPIIKGKPKALKLQSVHGVTTGMNNAIRAWSEYRKIY